MISHMPMVLAQALVLSIKDNPLAREIASSGFRDMTRLALSNQEMACDMVSMNSKNIEQAILNLYKSVGELTSGNYPEIIKELIANEVDKIPTIYEMGLKFSEKLKKITLAQMQKKLNEVTK